ncbi:hypothetical protein JKP88DRAFT_331756 [Tribonema minus]|uniref:CCR4-NOT transcription complex subunit 1 TTP binding domain-containing protein n=1 Tax=Tribonema minus TaxID=303371 RepID=A0A836C929_9STRA|nr:hypothetical protein JKP88DRAFT_331756 [Tribonema minus]
MLCPRLPISSNSSCDAYSFTISRFPHTKTLRQLSLLRCCPSCQMQAANDFYAQVYQNKLSIPKAVERLQQLQNQCAAAPPCADAAPMDAPPPLTITTSSSSGACNGGAAAAALSHATLDYTLRALLDQFPHIVKYAETELRVTAVLLGTMVNERVLDGRRAAVALRFVHEALRHAPGPGTAGKLFRFGLFALFQFKPRLAEWPAYCESVAAVPHLARYHPDLVCQLRAIADAAGDGGGGGGGGGDAVFELPPRGVKRVRR